VVCGGVRSCNPTFRKTRKTSSLKMLALSKDPHRAGLKGQSRRLIPKIKTKVLDLIFNSRFVTGLWCHPL